MPLMWVLITCDVVLVAMAAVIGYLLQPNRNHGDGSGWIGVAALAVTVVVLALRYELTYLILLAYFPSGYLAMRAASRIRDRRKTRDQG